MMHNIHHAYHGAATEEWEEEKEDEEKNTFFSLFEVDFTRAHSEASIQYDLCLLLRSNMCASECEFSKVVQPNGLLCVCFRVLTGKLWLYFICVWHLTAQPWISLQFFIIITMIIIDCVCVCCCCWATFRLWPQWCVQHNALCPIVRYILCPFAVIRIIILRLSVLQTPTFCVTHTHTQLLLSSIRSCIVTNCIKIERVHLRLFFNCT